MDIKDFILIGGGVLIAMVVGHGFWIAWRAKREPLRMDIVPDLIHDGIDEIERLRGELPNGGARVVTRRALAEQQENLPLDFDAPPPLLITPTSEAVDAGPVQEAAAHEPLLDSQPAATKAKPRVHQAPPRVPASAEPVKPVVREVSLRTEPVAEPRHRATAKTRDISARDKRDNETSNNPSKSNESGAVEELLIVNVLAPRGQSFDGERLVTALRNQGLRYGDMNIFHRVDPTTKAKIYSVANAVEPGTFDLSDLETLHTPGMTFFLQLPGPLEATVMFDDMLDAARNIAVELGADLRDEAMSGLTGQTIEHMRQRIADYARRRLSKRA